MTWATGYYEQEIPQDVVEHVFAHRPLTEAVVKRLNPEIRLADLRAEVVEIGYPP